MNNIVELLQYAVIIEFCLSYSGFQGAAIACVPQNILLFSY